MGELIASLPSAGFGAVAAIAIRSVVQAFKINKDAGGQLDALQASRITELEKRMDEKDRKHDAKDRECDAKIAALNSRLLVVAQVTVHVTAELRIHAPDSPTPDWATQALQRAFPLDLNTPPDMVAKARKLGE